MLFDGAIKCRCFGYGLISRNRLMLISGEKLCEELFGMVNLWDLIIMYLYEFVNQSTAEWNHFSIINTN